MLMKIMVSYPESVLVEASQLSLKDEFMQHKPKTPQEKKLKESLTEVIVNGVKDFYTSYTDPSFVDDKKTRVTIGVGRKPAVGKSYNWWKEYLKDTVWCIGTKEQYIAFLGVLIKKLVTNNGWRVGKAWNAVCNDSRELGIYFDSKDVNYSEEYAKTGTGEICGFTDLANTRKFFAEDTGGYYYWTTAGDHGMSGKKAPLATILQTCYLLDKSKCSHVYETNLNSVPWLVLKKDLEI